MDIKKIRDEFEDLQSSFKENEKKLYKIIEEYNEAIKVFEEKLKLMERVNSINENKLKEKNREIESMKNKMLERVENNSKTKDITSTYVIKTNSLQDINETRSMELTNKINEIKNKFINSDFEEIRKAMRSTKDTFQREGVIELTKYNLNNDNISVEDGYNLMLISVFIGCLQPLLDSSKYLRDLLKSKKSESELIKIINIEKDTAIRSRIDITSRVYLGSNRGKIKHIDKSVLDKSAELLYQLFYGIIDKVIFTENISQCCQKDGSELVTNNGYLKIADDKGNYNYLLVAEPICAKCGSLHITQKSFKKLEKRVEGYKIEYNE